MPEESRVLRIGEWRVDPNLDELAREGQTIRLEPRPMRLLLYLAAHAGRVVDVPELLDEVWSNVVVAQGSVYQAVAQLRRILGDDSEHPKYIENLPLGPPGWWPPLYRGITRALQRRTLLQAHKSSPGRQLARSPPVRLPSLRPRIPLRCYRS